MLNINSESTLDPSTLRMGKTRVFKKPQKPSKMKLSILNESHSPNLPIPLNKEAPEFVPGAPLVDFSEFTKRDILVQEILADLARFQTKLKEEGNQMKIKRHRRFLCGINEITKFIEVKKMLPSTSSSKKPILLLVIAKADFPSAFKSELEKLRDESEIVYDGVISKTKLGKLANKSIKQNVVAIINMEGAFEKFNLLKDTFI
jgi:ribosomal protein L7Ae-like RNA K-turn-binding protein